MLFNASDAATLASECGWSVTNSSECVGAVKVGAYTCLQDVDDTAPLLEFTAAAAMRYGTHQRVNCTVPAPSAATADASVPSPWVSEVGRGVRGVVAVVVVGWWVRLGGGGQRCRCHRFRCARSPP